MQDCNLNDIDIEIPEKYINVVGNYINFLHDKPTLIDKPKKLLLCFLMSSYFDDSIYFKYLINETYKIWTIFKPYISNLPFDLQREFYLYIPHEFVPIDFIEKPTFYEQWLEINKNNLITLDGKSEYIINVKYYGNGQIKQAYNYIIRKENRCYNEYKDNIRINTIELCGKMIRHGLGKDYYDNGQIEQEVYCENDMQQGLTRGWYDDGSLHFEGNFKDNQRYGPWKSWHKNGQLKWQSNHINDDKLEGSYKEWYDNGIVNLEGIYINGKRSGLWKCWNENGKLNWEINYKNGDADGTYKVWHNNGQIKLRGELVNGKKMDY